MSAQWNYNFSFETGKDIKGNCDTEYLKTIAPAFVLSALIHCTHLPVIITVSTYEYVLTVTNHPHYAKSK